MERRNNRRNTNRQYTRNRNIRESKETEPEDTEPEVLEIYNEITILQERIRTLLLQAESIQGRRPRNRRNNIGTNTIEIGTRVRVLNDYRNLRGTTGVLIGTSSAQVTIRPDNGEREFRRYRQNVEIIEDE